MKKSFILYTDSIQFIEWLTDEDAWKLLKACLLYHKDEEVNLPPLPNMAFLMLKTQFDRDKEKYEEVIDKKREAWRLWGKAKASKCQQMLAPANSAKQNLANVADNDNDNDNDNVTDNVNETVIDTDTKDILYEDKKPKKKKSFDYSSLENDPEDSFAKEAYLTLKKMWWNESIPLQEFIEYIDAFLVSKDISKQKWDFIKWQLWLKDFLIYWSNDKSTKKPNYLLKMRNSPSFTFNQKQYAKR